MVPYVQICIWNFQGVRFSGKTFITCTIYHNFLGQNNSISQKEFLLLLLASPALHNNYQQEITRPLKMQFHCDCWISQQCKEMIKSEQRWGTIEEPRTANMWNHNSWGAVWFTRHPIWDWCWCFILWLAGYVLGQTPDKTKAQTDFTMI